MKYGDNKSFTGLATEAAAIRREMAAEVLSLMMVKDAEGVLTPEEIQYAMNEAVSQGWATRNDDGTFSLTEAGRQCISARGGAGSTAMRVYPRKSRALRRRRRH